MYWTVRSSQVGSGMQYVKHLAALKCKVMVSEKHLRPPSNQVPAPVLQDRPKAMMSDEQLYNVHRVSTVDKKKKKSRRAGENPKPEPAHPACSGSRCMPPPKVSRASRDRRAPVTGSFGCHGFFFPSLPPPIGVRYKSHPTCDRHFKYPKVRRPGAMRYMRGRR